MKTLRICSISHKRSKWRVAAAAMLFLTVQSFVGASAAIADVTYMKTVTMPTPPALSFAGNSGGDGWDISLDQNRVYNVFHHQRNVFLACQNQLDASTCGSLYPKMITDDVNDLAFQTSNHSGTHLDQMTGRLYTYAVQYDPDEYLADLVSGDPTAGVVCIDTTLPDSNANPFCGFTALTAVGATHVHPASLSGPSLIGNQFFAMNHRGTGRGQVLCFNVDTEMPCTGQPQTTFGVVLGGYSSAAIDGRFVFQNGNNLGCYDPSTFLQCSGAWPVQVQARRGGPFPYMDTLGNVIGVCLPIGGHPCFDMMGGTLTTPAGLAAATPIGSGASFSILPGAPLVIGTRVYVVGPQNGAGNTVGCFDFATLAGCPNFPKFFDANLVIIYTVNADPYRPSCIWVNSDRGASQIQAFDAFSGGTCGEDGIRVLVSQIVVDQELCHPSEYTSLELLAPVPSAYTSASVRFQDTNGVSTSISDQVLDANGVVNLIGLGLDGVPPLPHFLLTLTGTDPNLTEVRVKMTWNGVEDPSCIGDGTEVMSGNEPPVADAGDDQTIELVSGISVMLDGSLSSDADNDPLTFAWLLVSAPTGSLLTGLIDPALVMPSFIPDVLGNYVFQLVVNDETEDSDPDTVLVTVEDTTPPVAECREGPNPSGNIPQAPGKGRKGQNQDGYYTVLADDLVDPDVEVFVVDTDTWHVFGPFASATNIKYTEANGASPKQKPGSGVVDWNLKGQGDAAVYAVDASGNESDHVGCLVPPYPQ